MATERMSGTVKWFSRVKGYGFIAPDGEESEIFVHFTGIEGEGYRNLEKGEKVSFVIEETEKGPQAAQVRAEGFDVTSWTAEPTDDPSDGGSESSWRAAEEDDSGSEEELSDEPEAEASEPEDQTVDDVEDEAEASEPEEDASVDPMDEEADAPESDEETFEEVEEQTEVSDEYIEDEAEALNLKKTPP